MGPPSGVGRRGTLCDCFLIAGGPDPLLPEPLPGTTMLVGEVGRGSLGGCPPDACDKRGKTEVT